MWASAPTRNSRNVEPRSETVSVRIFCRKNADLPLSETGGQIAQRQMIILSFGAAFLYFVRFHQKPDQFVFEEVHPFVGVLGIDFPLLFALEIVINGSLTFRGCVGVHEAGA